MPTSFPERLELGEIHVEERCSFALFGNGDLVFLRNQQRSWLHKNISLHVPTGKLTGHTNQSHQETARLQRLLQTFGQRCQQWAAPLLGEYAAALRSDRVVLHCEEQATRPLRRNARNDLLHFDSFPTRPTQGDRILRIFVNVDRSEPRVWAVSETFPHLFDKLITESAHPGRMTRERRVGRRLLNWLTSMSANRSGYDDFMLHFSKILKGDDDFQEHARKHFFHFPPFSLWAAMTDGVCFAELRGRCVLEHSWFVPRSCLVRPELAPAAIFEQYRTGRPKRSAA